MSLAERLRLLRGNTGQNEFAIRIGSSQSGVSAYEKGQRKPDYETLIRVSEEFNVPFDWLLLGKGPMISPSGENLYHDRDSNLREPAQHTENTNADPKDYLYPDRDCVAPEAQNLSKECPTCRTFSSEQILQPVEKTNTESKEVSGMSAALDVEECSSGSPQTVSITAPQSSCTVLKPLTRQRFSEPKNSQHIENTDSESQKTSDVIEILAVQLELNTAYKATAVIQRELTDAIRENADLRVELEQKKAHIRDLEREKAGLARDVQEIRLAATEITDLAVVRLAHENEALKAQLARMKQLDMFDEPVTLTPQADIHDRK